jgi:hypothetical protein
MRTAFSVYTDYLSFYPIGEKYITGPLRFQNACSAAKCILFEPLKLLAKVVNIIIYIVLFPIFT